jgi:hypothetical protein
MSAMLALMIFSIAGAGPMPGEPLFTAPDSFWVGNTKHKDPKTGHVPMYGATDRRASWYIAAWNNPGADLPAFTSHPGPNASIMYESKADAAEVEVQKVGSTVSVSLSQSDARMPCQLASGDPGEFDLLVGMNHPWVNPDISDASLPAARARGLDRLSDIEALNQRVVVEALAEGSPLPQTSCRNNQGNLMSAVVLRNDIANPHQILFYQLALRTICHPGPTYEECMTRRQRSGFWWAGERMPGGSQQRFGYRDTLASFGRNMVPAAGAEDISVDLLPTIARLLQSRQHGLDPDLSHWRVMSAYFGQNIWGNVSLSSRWSGYTLNVVPRGATP